MLYDLVVCDFLRYLYSHYRCVLLYYYTASHIQLLGVNIFIIRKYIFFRRGVELGYTA